MSLEKIIKTPFGNIKLTAEKIADSVNIALTSPIYNTHIKLSLSECIKELEEIMLWLKT